MLTIKIDFPEINKISYKNESILVDIIKTDMFIDVYSKLKMRPHNASMNITRQWRDTPYEISPYNPKNKALLTWLNYIQNGNLVLQIFLSKSL